MTHIWRWCTLAGITAGVLGLAVPASAATGWTVVTPPASTAGAELTGSYALSGTDAWVVGGASASSTAPVALNWNGTAWSAVPTPTPSGPSGTDLDAVVALSPTDVWAGGTNGTGPLLEHFNGTSWQVMRTPSSFSGAGVLAMTARSDSDVWIFSESNPLTEPLLLANWNGSSWTTSQSPIPADSSVQIGSAATSPSHTWLFGADNTTGEPMILSHS